MRAMTGAVSASALFLIFYILRLSLTGTHDFAGEGVARVVYLSILFSHMTLALRAAFSGAMIAPTASAAAAATVLAQVVLGVLSVSTVLSVPAVSLHTLGAAGLLALLVALTTLTWEPEAVVATGEGAVSRHLRQTVERGR